MSDMSGSTQCFDVQFIAKRAIYSKFAVECDWNSKFSQNVQNLLFSKKNDAIFGEKGFFQNR